MTRQTAKIKRVRLVAGASHLVRLGNGELLRVDVVRSKGLLHIDVWDADTNAKIQTIPAMRHLTKPPE